MTSLRKRAGLMDNKELAEAKAALIDWLSSQEINMPNSLLLMASTILTGLMMMGANCEQDPEEGLEALIEGMRGQLKDMIEDLKSMENKR